MRIQSVQAYTDEQRALRGQIGRLHWQAWQLRLEHKGSHHTSKRFHTELFYIHDAIAKCTYRIRSCDLLKKWICCMLV